MRRRIIITILFVLVACGQAFSQEMTLEQCIDQALTNNSALKSNEMGTVAAREESNMALKDFFPSLRLQGNYSILDQSPRLIVNRNSFSQGVPSADAQLPLGDKDFYSAAINLRQPIFTGGILTGNYRKTREASEASHLEYKGRKKQLVYEVKKTFYEALNENLHTEAIEKMLNAKKERLSVLKELSAEGYAARDVVLRQETDILFTELDLLKNRNRGETALDRLKKLIHREESENLTLGGTAFNALLIPSLQQVREAALAHREELQSGRSRVRMADADVTVARGSFFPQASVTGSYLRQKETSITRPEAWMLTATVDWPIFEWGKTVNDVRRATARKQQEEYRLDDSTREIGIEAEQAWRAVKEEEKAVAAHESEVRTGEYCLEQDLKKFVEGTVKLADLLTTEAEFIKAHNGYLSAVNSLDIAFARLEAATSTPLESWLVPQPLYRPDMEDYSRRSAQLIRQRKGRRAQFAPALSPTAEVAQTAKPQPHPVPSAVDTKIMTATTSAVTIQIGAYISQGNARETRREILKKIRDKEVQILSVGKFYKVRILGFTSAAEAKDAMVKAGISNYLVMTKNIGE
ncbi:MAG: TolC family protein [Geobacteraceae bacterium]|nr:TolC family protein [Geobacteraceae bacterium]